MLTYPIFTSMAPLAKGRLVLGFAWEWLDQNPKEAKKTKGDFLDFIV